MKATEAITNRVTTKILGDILKPAAHSNEINDEFEELIRLAANAPFHYAVHKNHRSNSKTDGIEPWRASILHEKDCRLLLKWIVSEEIDSGKIGKMLAVCKSLILVNWCPDPGTEESNDLFNPTLRNMEHIAAVAAFSQNILLAFTEKGYKTYWSSGGVLREDVLRKKLNTPKEEVLLSAIFIFHHQNDAAKEVSGKLRPLRSEISGWFRRLEL